MKDVLCVIEGECKVYTCCTFTGSEKGCYGKFTDYSGGFKELWEGSVDWRQSFNAKETCTCACLYRNRNLSINELIDQDGEPAERKCVHSEFI